MTSLFSRLQKFLRRKRIERQRRDTPPCPVCGARLVLCDDCHERPEGEW